MLSFSAILHLEDKSKYVSLADLMSTKGAVQLKQAYASMLYVAQGVTIDRAFVVAHPYIKLRSPSDRHIL